jgi:hypothetical protein
VLATAAVGTFFGVGRTAGGGDDGVRGHEGADPIGLSLSRLTTTSDAVKESDAFCLHENGDGTIALKFGNGKYVSTSRHGGLTANAGRIGPDERFNMVIRNDGAIALKNFYGKFVRVQRNGTFAAVSSYIGARETFAKIGNGSHVSGRRGALMFPGGIGLPGKTQSQQDGECFYLKSSGTGLMLGETRVKLRLLTTAFVPRGDTSEHVNEIFAAIEMNLLNDLIDEVHILTESSCPELARAMRKWASRMPDTVRILVKMDQKLVCAMMRSGKQPTYRDFFLYLNTSISDGLVLFSNADVVFDETLHRLEPDKIIGKKLGFVLSVRPPPLDGTYKAVFGKDCKNTMRCTVGRWGGGGNWGQGPGSGTSWDAYVLAPPLPANMDLDHIKVKMNLYGAENLAAYQLQANGGIELYNSCEHIYAFHWHCIGGKMHSKDKMKRVDWPRWYTRMKGLPKHSPPDALAGLLPCWYCPGVKLPGGTATRTDLCKHGETLGVDKVPKLKSVFVVGPIAVNLCCPKGHWCGYLDLETLPQCRLATDVKCVIWEIAGWPKYY